MARKRVEISGKRWRVEVAKKPLRGRWGYCDHRQKRIVLCPTTDRAGITREIFLHEFTHGAMWFLDEDCVKQFAIDADDALDVMEL